MKITQKLSFTRGAAAGLSQDIAYIRHPLTRRAFAVATLVLGLLAGCDAAGPEPLEEELEAEEALSDEEPFVPGGALERTGPGGAALTTDSHWADGYAWANSPYTASYSPLASYAYNRSGGSIVINKVVGTAGRYVVRFNGLSALLGAKSTVKVTGHAYGSGTYCNPVRPKLVNDAVEVRCFTATGAPTSAYFTILVMKNYADVAFAHAHKPTGDNYAPAGGSSSNPYGAIRVFKEGTGAYRVKFSGLGRALSRNEGHVQVSQVGTGSHHCKLALWGSVDTDYYVYVQCYNKGGSRVDAKFNVFVAIPSQYLGYAWAHSSSSPSYTPNTLHSWNWTGGSIQITRSRVGTYTVTFDNLVLLDEGNVQVTAYGTGNEKCKQSGWGRYTVSVQCYAPNGTLVDSQFSVLLGS